MLKVQRPTATEIKSFAKGQKLFCIMAPESDPRGAGSALKDKGVDAFAMEFMPRITRAQSMDVLSSQANLAGYKAVLEAANTYGKGMPQMMTAAGTVAPAKVFVMGVGVAGCRPSPRRGGLAPIVTATDVRARPPRNRSPRWAAKFIAVKNEEFAQAQTAGGYAKEMSDDYKRQQAELVAGHIAKQDIVITTALIPGRKAPVLVTAEMVASMKPGSVLVDLAVEQGGNVEGAKVRARSSRPTAVRSSSGTPTCRAGWPRNRSALFARNHFNFPVALLRRGRLRAERRGRAGQGHPPDQGRRDRSPHA